MAHPGTFSFPGFGDIQCLQVFFLQGLFAIHEKIMGLFISLSVSSFYSMKSCLSFYLTTLCQVQVIPIASCTREVAKGQGGQMPWAHGSHWWERGRGFLPLALVIAGCYSTMLNFIWNVIFTLVHAPLIVICSPAHKWGHLAPFVALGRSTGAGISSPCPDRPCWLKTVQLYCSGEPLSNPPERNPDQRCIHASCRSPSFYMKGLF